MDAKKRKRLEHAGWTVGRVAGFLKLTPEEAALVEMRLLSRSQPRVLRIVRVPPRRDEC